LAGTDQPQARGGCFGFEIRSPLSFEYLRTTGGDPLYVTERDEHQVHGSPGDFIYEWPAVPGQRVRTSLYSAGGAYALDVETAGWFEVEPRAGRIAVPKLGPTGRAPWREAIIWGTPIGLCFIAPGRLSLHAASVDVGGQGLLLAATGTFGKTTLAGAFLREGFRLLSDDVSCCTVGEVPQVFPGPALLRLRPDVFEAVEFPGTRLADRTVSKVSLTFDGPQRGDGRPIPLRGIVLLHKTEDDPTLTRVPSHEAVRDLLILASNMLVDQARAFEDVAGLVSAVPVWRLDRRLVFGDLPRVVDMIATTCVPQ
jgi:hypothetical protein